MFTSLREYYCKCEKSFMKAFVAPEGAMRSLINCLVSLELVLVEDYKSENEKRSVGVELEKSELNKPL